MSSKTWSTSSQESEQDVPVPPLSKCTAIRDFRGEQPNDLSFTCGEVLTIIEPCNVVYWYLAENSKGQRGIIPITYVELHRSPKGRPPALLPTATPPPSSSSPLPPLPPKPEASSKVSDTKTFITYPRLSNLSSSTTQRKKVSRAHSNEFLGSQSSHRIQLSHSSSTLPRMLHSKSMLFSHIPSPLQSPPSKNSPLPLPPHDYTQPINHFSHSNHPLPLPPPTNPSHFSHLNHPPPLTPPPNPSPHLNPPPYNHPSPLHNPSSLSLSSVPPPLPSPRNRAKPVAPPVVPKPNQSLRHSVESPKAGMDIQSRQLPATPGLGLKNTNGSSVDIDRRPPAPLPIQARASMNSYTMTTVKQVSKYKDQKEFLQKSGWFSPNLETVLCKMMYSGHISALTSTTTGIYIFTHKHQRTKRYVGMSRTAYHDLTQMFHRLFEREDGRLGLLEREIKFNSPDADQWTFRMYSVSNDTLESECNQRILQNNTLSPSGLNTDIKFTSKESFHHFAAAYSKTMREKASKNINPIRAARKLQES